MKRKIEFVQLREFDDVVRDTTLFFKQNFKPLAKAYFTICGFFLVASLIVSIFSEIKTTATLKNTYETGSMAWTYVLAAIFVFLNITLTTTTTLSFIILYKEKGNHPPNVEEVWAYVKYYFFRMFGSVILLTAGLAVSILFCVMPVFYFAAIFSIITPIMIMENTNLAYAFNRAFKLSRNNWWPTLGILLVMSILVIACMALLSIPVMIVTTAGSLVSQTNLNTTYAIIFIVVSHLCHFLYVIPIISTALIYFSLTERKDANSLMNRIDMFGKKDQQTDLHSSEEY